MYKYVILGLGLVIVPCAGAIWLVDYQMSKIIDYDYTLEVTCDGKSKVLTNVDYFSGNGGFSSASAYTIHFSNGLGLVVPVSCQIKELEKFEKSEAQSVGG